ncbi:MAG TPA: sugar ABC transporter substrate-binding protein [Chromatiaceae bacterium]|nr:sugar ABC transporter substrate-binding protein [Chromatiaceae bacterium]HIB84528.1 sugar ABC transporter substrate-binding protein [Chromatiaceae bacterium]HIN81805.1 sugar ABC transporter substrate-binding protein [Chromatiales bacterium]HIO13600.1 sugar ABC transporter substrate-binding protein [Chromatiales bacterium]
MAHLFSHINTCLMTGLALVGVLLSGCASNSYPPLSADADVASDYTYVIGAGDSVFIYVWGNPEVSRSVSVRPDGKITAPLVEELPATGKTAEQLARDIEEVLGTYIKNPLVTVMISGYVGPYNQQIRVLGEATSPQALPYRVEMTMLDLMIAVGGLTQFADGNGASVVRMVNDEMAQFGVRIEDLIKDGDISANVDLLPGDIVIIPEAFF